MGKVIVSESITLDGVMQSPGFPDEDTEGGFTHGGWIASYWDEDAAGVTKDDFANAEAFLIGRKTYDIWATYWPAASPEEADVAEFMNSTRKYVVSDTPFEPEWENTRLITGDDVVEQIKTIKAQAKKNILVGGSGQLVQTLMEAGLVDEYELMVVPLILGTGKRLFREGNPRQELELLGTKTTRSGIAVLIYKITVTGAAK